MTTQIVIQPSEGIQKEFVVKVQSWANEVLEKKGYMSNITLLNLFECFHQARYAILLGNPNFVTFDDEIHK